MVQDGADGSFWRVTAPHPAKESAFGWGNGERVSRRGGLAQRQAGRDAGRQSASIRPPGPVDATTASLDDAIVESTLPLIWPSIAMRLQTAVAVHHRGGDSPAPS